MRTIPSFLQAIRLFGTCCLGLLALVGFTHPAIAQQPSEGHALYRSLCASCHGADLRGGLGPDLLPEPVAGTPEVLVSDHVWNQGGLLDVTVDPNYEENGWIYLSYSHPQPNLARGDTIPSMTRIVRGRLNRNQWTDEQVLFEASSNMYTTTVWHYGSRCRRAYRFVLLSISKNSAASACLLDTLKPQAVGGVVVLQPRLPCCLRFERDDGETLLGSHRHSAPWPIPRDTGLFRYPETAIAAFWEGGCGMWVVMDPTRHLFCPAGNDTGMVASEYRSVLEKRDNMTANPALRLGPVRSQR